VETRRSNQRINQKRSWFFENINKIDKPLAKLIRGHRDSIIINKIRNGKGDIMAETKVIKKFIKSYYKAIVYKTGKSV
jgi:hypothetical protein